MLQKWITNLDTILLDKMDNKIHDAINKTVLFMKETHNIEYVSSCEKQGPLFRVIFNGPQDRKIVSEVDNGNISVLMTRDVLYGELEILMNKFISEL